MERAQISVAQVSAESALFEQVVALGNANSRTLGFFPKGAFVDAAVESRLLAALDANQNLAGYVLYRTSGQRAMVVHLCVEAAHRRRGITKVLVNETGAAIAPLGRPRPVVPKRLRGERTLAKAWIPVRAREARAFNPRSSSFTVVDGLRPPESLFSCIVRA